MTKLSSRTLIIYGEEDFPFIVAPSISIYERLDEIGVKCKILPLKGSGHEFRDSENNYVQEHGEKAMKELIKWYGHTL